MRFIATSSDPIPTLLDSSAVAAWVRVDATDGSLDYLFKSAARWAEGFCDQWLFARTFTVSLLDFHQSGTLVGVNPATVSVVYDTATESGQTLAPLAYQLLPNGTLRFIAESVLGLAPISATITYTAGYDTNNLPEDIGMALLLVVGNLYDNRNNPISEKRTAAENLLQPYKAYSI